MEHRAGFAGLQPREARHCPKGRQGLGRRGAMLALARLLVAGISYLRELRQHGQLCAVAADGAGLGLARLGQAFCMGDQGGEDMDRGDADVDVGESRGELQVPVD